MVRLIDEQFEKSLYNQFAPHLLQSWQWGEARKKMGVEVLRIGQCEKDTLKSVYQLTFHHIPHTPYTIGYIPRSTLPTQEVIDFLKEEGRRRKCIFIKCEPYIKKSDASFVPSQLTKSPHPLFPSWTQQIDLTASEDQLFSLMHPKTRYNIRLAQKKGVVVKEMTSLEGFKTFSKLYFETCRRQRYLGHNLEYHHTIFTMLKDTIAHILIAYYQDIPIAAYEVFIFNDVLYYPYGGSSYKHKNLMGNNLLMWTTIKFGKKIGCRTFDMWGSLPPHTSSTHPWAGFTRFKKGYGGEFVEFVGNYDLVIYPSLYKLYNLFNVLRQKLLIPIIRTLKK